MSCSNIHWGESPDSLGPLGIDYVYLHDCTFSNYSVFFFLFVIIWVCSLMNIIASTASNYFSPTLGAISEKFGLKYDFAGVTFLALGNGSPDFFSLIASFSGGVDELVGVGALLGGGMFVCTVVVGAIAILCPCDVAKNIFIRDVSFHLIATSCVTFVAIYQDVNLGIAISLIVAYVAYVYIVVSRSDSSKVSTTEDNSIPMVRMPTSGAIQTAFWHRTESAKPKPKSKKPIIPTSSNSSNSTSGGYNFLILKDVDDPTKENPDTIEEETTINLSGGYIPEFDEIINEEYCSIPHAPSNNSFTIEDANEDEEQQSQDCSVDNPLNQSLLGASEGTSVQSRLRLAGGATRGENRSNMYQSMIQTEYWKDWMKRHAFRKSIFSVEEWNRMSWVQRILYIVELPVTFLRDITIPTLDEQSWSKTYAMIHPFSDVIFIEFLFGDIRESWSTIPLILVSVLAAAVPSFVIFLFTHTSKPPTSPIFASCWSLGAFVMCIFWIFMLANELIACLSAMGIILRWPPAFLGLTVLAWGNSIGDFFTNTAVAKQGLGEMALAGCYGGPVFNILVGFGVTLVYASSKSYPKAFSVKLDASSIVSIVFLFIALSSTLTIVSLRQYRIERWFGFYLISLYGLYTLCQFALLLFF